MALGRNPAKNRASRSSAKLPMTTPEQKDLKTQDHKDLPPHRLAFESHTVTLHLAPPHGHFRL